MWPRHFELSFAFWLALSPFIFSYSDEPCLWATTFISSFLIICFSLLSLSKRFKYLHLLNVGIGLWLILFGFMQTPPEPAYQNGIIVGILLLMFGILPTKASSPTDSWIDFYSSDTH